MVIADAVLFVRKQISRARGSIQIVAVFIWEFYKWLYVIARILVRYVTGIIVFQIVPQLARKFCCFYSQWNWKSREWDVGDKTNWYKKLSKSKNQKKKNDGSSLKEKKKKKTYATDLYYSPNQSNSSKRLFSAKIEIVPTLVKCTLNDRWVITILWRIIFSLVALYFIFEIVLFVHYVICIHFAISFFCFYISKIKDVLYYYILYNFIITVINVFIS